MHLKVAIPMLLALGVSALCLPNSKAGSTRYAARIIQISLSSKASLIVYSISFSINGDARSVPALNRKVNSPRTICPANDLKSVPPATALSSKMLLFLTLQYFSHSGSYLLYISLEHIEN